MHLADRYTHALYKVDGIDTVERRVVPMWLKDRVDGILLNPKISALLFPNAHLAQYYKQRLLQYYPTLAGLHFLTPSRVRASIKECVQMDQPLASREDLFMLAHLALEKSCTSSEFLHVREDPKVLVQAVDALIQAGWDGGALGDEFKPFVKTFNKLLQEANLMTAQQLDQILAQTHIADVPFHAVLAIGFSGKDWPHYRILQALHRHCEDFAMCLQSSLNSEADRLWVSSWEYILPRVINLEKDDGRDLDQESDLNVNQTKEEVAFEIVVTQHEIGEVEAVIYKTLDILAKDAEASIAIVTSEPTPMSREIALRLRKLDIPHNDCIRFNSAEEASILGLQQWVAYQHSPNLNMFLGLLHQLHALALVSDENVAQIKRDLDAAFYEMLTDRMEVLHAFLKRMNAQSQSVAILERWGVLPERARVGEFIERTRKVCEVLLPENVRMVLDEKQRRIENLLHYECSGRLFADWIFAVGHSPSRTTEAKGRFPFARIHLVSEHQGFGMTFDHVIFVGMTKESWPRAMPEHPLLTDEMVVRFNREAEMEGRHGLGDRCVRPELGYMLSQADRKAQQYDRFIKLKESARKGVVLTASLSSGGSNQSNNTLSEYLLEAAWEESVQLSSIVEAPLVYVLPEIFESSATSANENSMLEAYQRRRNPDTSFDAHSYCLEDTDAAKLTLSCKAIEEMLQKPSQSWAKHVLEITQPIDYTVSDGFALAQGNWIHSWLCWGVRNVGEFQKPALDAWLKSVEEKGQKQLHRITQLYADCDQSVPEWTQRFVYETLLCGKLLLKKAYECAEGYDYCVQEAKVDNTLVQCGSMAPYPFMTKGRIDILFGKHALGELNVEGLNEKGVKNVQDRDNEILILDFKTGQNTYALNASNLKKFRGVQGALYGLCMKTKGFENYSVGYVTHRHQSLSLIKPSDITSAENLWKGVVAMLHAGRFGELPEAGYGAGFALEDRSLASTRIDAQILKKKWELTHPLLHQSFES